ncbi:MAG: hypothetical protein ACR2O4_02220 [Hyphomicrobiaceae bacterium]
MREPRRTRDSSDLVDRPAGTAREAASGRTGTVLTALISLLALAMSGVSLYQTVLKQANLHLFVPDTISYTRDPNGSFEVIVVPVTIANSGARDGVVSSFQLKVRNMNTGRERVLHATYVADQGYFSTDAEETNGVVRARPRPKTAFAPLAVAGRSGYSGTLLFYPREYSKDRVVPKEGKFRLELSAEMRMIEKFDAIDRVLGGGIAPIEFTASLPKVSRYFQGRMATGKFVRLFVDDGSVPAK